jgi:hypothetical protein
MTTKLRWHAGRPPKIDDRNTGVTFVDVLFALVVGKILDVSVSGELSTAAIGHLLVGAVLTITSWVGYHNSVNRAQYFLRFWNLPIFLFLIDILLVYVYWLIPVTTVQHQVDGNIPPPDALRVTGLVTIATLLYVAWDSIALWIRKSHKYPRRPEAQDIPSRRYASIVLFVLTLMVLALVWCKDPHTTTTVVAIDAILIVLLIAYRTVKEGFTPQDALSREGA